MRAKLWLGTGLLAAGLLAMGAPSPTPGTVAPVRLGLPVTGAVLTQGFGCTELELEPVAPWCAGGHFHGGLDLAAPLGTEVRAAAAGRARVSYEGGYGLHVTLDHGGSVVTLYGHLEQVLVANGQLVAAGARIGLVGSTGVSTGPHLHFEVRRQGRPVDPTPLLPALN